MKIKYGEMSSQKVSKPPVSSLSSKLKNAVLVAGLLTAFGMGGSKAAEAVKPADADSQKVAARTVVDTGKTVILNINGEKRELKKMRVKELKDILNKNVKAGLFFSDEPIDYSDPALVNEPEFSITISNLEVPIFLGNGGVISSFIRMPEKTLNDEKAITILVFKDGKRINGGTIPFKEFEEDYKALAGKELRYVIAVVDHDVDKDGEYVQFIIISADTFEDVLKGNIKSGQPVFVVVYGVPENKFYSEDKATHYTTDDDTFAEK